MRTLALLILAGSALGFGVTAIAQDTPMDMRDLVGARAGQAEGQFAARGYEFVGAQTGDDRKWTTWWHPQRRSCIMVATVNGRYDSIVSTPEADCRRGGGDRNPGYRPDPGYRPNPGQRPDPGYRPDRPGRPGDDGYGWAGGRRIDMGLVCFGEGRRPALAPRYGWSWNDRSDRYDYGNRTELSSQDFDASVTVQIWNGGGRIRLPRTLVPPINSRGSNGWWDLTNVAAGRDQITAIYRLNGLNKPRVTIDRRSGRISIRGTGSYAFRGSCDRIDGRDHRRF
jgi:hypothetical protein